MTFYQTHVLPRLIDFSCGMSMVRNQREHIVPRATGEVLDIGYGSGLNLPHYDPARVKKVWGIEPSLAMHERARRRTAQSSIAVELLAVSAESMPLQDRCFDTVVVTFALCTIPNVGAALAEMRRLLKPQGKLLFCEHGRSPDPGVQRWQRRLNPLWQRVGGGCQLNRAIPDLIEASGFQIQDLNSGYLPGPKPLTFNYWGIAAPMT